MDPIHTYIDTVHCPICMLYFHNRTRVLNHIEYRSNICRMNILLRGPCLSNDQARHLDMSQREANRALYAKGLRSRSAVDPVFRLSGPITHILIDPDNYSNHHSLGIGRRYYG